MLNPKCECIASRAFASLILDYEWKAEGNLPALVSCRVLVEDLYQDTIHAGSRDEAIEIFKNWHK
jgi:hypothetical protein